MSNITIDTKSIQPHQIVLFCNPKETELWYVYWMLYDYQVMQYVCTQPHNISLILQILLMILSKKKTKKRKQFCESAFVIQLSCIAESDNILGPSIIGLVGCQMVDAASFVLNEGLQKQGGSETLLEPHLAEIRNYVPSYILSGFAYKTLMKDPKSFWLYLKIPWKKISSAQNTLSISLRSLQATGFSDRRDFQRTIHLLTGKYPKS